MKNYQKSDTKNNCFYYKETPDNEGYHISYIIPTTNGEKNIYLNNDLIDSIVRSLIEQYGSQSLICAIKVGSEDYVLEIKGMQSFKIKKFSNKYTLLDEGDSKLNLIEKK